MIIQLKDVRLDFPWLYKMQPPQKGGEGKPAFSAQFLFAPSHPALELTRKTIQQVANEKWGARAQQILFGVPATNGMPAELGLIDLGQVCLHAANAAKVAKYPRYQGMWYVSARGQVRPSVVHDREIDPATGKLRLISEQEGKVYGGCYVNAILDVYAVEKPKMWVTAQLMGVQYVRDGDAFGGGRAADPSMFDAVGNAGTQLPPQAANGGWGSAHDLAG